MSALAVSILCCVWTEGNNIFPEQPLMCVRIESPAALSIAGQLIEAGFDVPTGSITGDSFEVIVSSEELDVLRDNGLEPRTVTVGRPFRDIQSQYRHLSSVPSGYPDLAQIHAQMYACEVDFPSICRVVDLTEKYDAPSTFEGRHIIAMKISDHVTEDEDKPVFLMVGAHHAREIVTPVVALYAIEQFTQQYGLDPTITALVDEYEIWVVPVWNPDGYEYVFTADNYWRKNRRVLVNGVGVDLNRNYPFGWDAACGGSTAVTSQTYRGPAAASEPETQTMIAFGRDRHFEKVADIHSHARQVRYANGCLPHPFMSFLASEAAELAAAAGYEPSLSCCTGGDIHFHMANYSSHAFLWETHDSFQPDYASARIEAALVFPSLLMLLKRPVSLSGHITNAVTRAPVAATINYFDVDFDNGETNSSDERWGRYHAFMPDGTYTLEFVAIGYFSEYRMVDITSDSSQTLDVTMIPSVGDINKDNLIDMADFAILARCWHHRGEANCSSSDLSKDEYIDFSDLMILADNWLANSN